MKIDANAAMAKARYIAEQMEFISRNPGMQVGLAAGASYFAEELEINDYPFQVCIPIECPIHLWIDVGWMHPSTYGLNLKVNEPIFQLSQARRKVTNRQAMDDITERTGISCVYMASRRM